MRAISSFPAGHTANHSNGCKPSQRRGAAIRKRAMQWLTETPAGFSFPRVVLTALTMCVFAHHAEAQPAFAVPQTKTGWGSGAVDFGDLNDDGHIDAVTANTVDGSFSVLLGDDDGAFFFEQTVSAGAQPTAVALRDFSLNGRLDVAVLDRAEGTLQIFWGDGFGGFSASTRVDVPENSSRLLAGDFNGDRRDDLVVLGVVAGARLVINTPDGSGAIELTVSTLPVPTASPIYDSLDAGDNDNDGDLDLAISRYEGTPGRGSTILELIRFRGHPPAFGQKESTCLKDTRPRTRPSSGSDW